MPMEGNIKEHSMTHTDNGNSVDCLNIPVRNIPQQKALKSTTDLFHLTENIPLLTDIKTEDSSYPPSPNNLNLTKEDNSSTSIYEKENFVENDIQNSFKPENIDDLIKCEIDENETNPELETARLSIENERFDKYQLKIGIERLSIANKNHKKAIEHLPKIQIELNQLNSRIIRKIDKFGFVNVTSALVTPLLPVLRQKKVYPKGHYFSRKKNVVYDKDEFDKHFFHLALRRKANIEDNGKFLKYQCPTCPYKTWSYNGVSKHHIGLHGFKINYKFECPDCNFTSKNECSLNRHQQRHKKEPDLPCPHCPYITRFDVALRVHLRRWHLPDDEAKTLKCPECNFVSVCKTTFKTHLKVHMNRGNNYLARFVHKSEVNNETNILKCEYCKFCTPNKNGLRRHMQETHKINNPFKKAKYRCKQCGFETKHLFSYRNHLLTHESADDVPEFQCYNCPFKTKFKKYLVVHIRTEHSKIKKEKTESVFFHCAECDKQYMKKYLLKQHIFQQHRDSERFMCHYCNYTTKIISLLKRHTEVKHINPKIKIYQCQKCSLVSKTKEEHKTHLRTHKYICYICSLEMSTKYSLEDHIIGHMPEEKRKKVVRMLKCPCCNYETRRQPNFYRHKKRFNHYDKKPLMAKVKEKNELTNNIDDEKAAKNQDENNGQELIEEESKCNNKIQLKKEMINRVINQIEEREKVEEEAREQIKEEFN